MFNYKSKKNIFKGLVIHTGSNKDENEGRKNL
jgi:hypothetical protein